MVRYCRVLLLAIVLCACGAATGTPTDSPLSTARPSPMWTATPLPTHTPVLTPSPTATQVPTETPVPTATAVPTRTPTATQTLSPPTPTRTPKATATRTATPMPTRTPVALPDDIQLIAPVPVEDFGGDDLHLTCSSGSALWLWSEQAAAQWVEGTWQVTVSDPPGSVVGVDDQGSVWVLRQDGGVSAWDGNAWVSYGVDEGWDPVPETWASDVRGPVVDAMGRTWFVTWQGARMFHEGRWLAFSLPEMGMPGEPEEDLVQVLHLVADTRSDDVWIGSCTWGGPGPFGGGGVRWFTNLESGWQGTDSPVADGCAITIRADDSGMVWAGVDASVWRHDTRSQEWFHIAPPEEVPLGRARFGYVSDLLVTPAGDLWVLFGLCGGASCYDDLLYHYRDGVWRQLSETPSYSGMQHLVQGADGAVWVIGREGIYTAGETIHNVAPLSAGAFCVDETRGGIWFVASHQGQETLFWIGPGR